MKKIFLLCSIVMCCLSGYAQSLAASPTTVENDGTVTVTVSGETIFRHYKENSITFKQIGLVTEPVGYYMQVGIKDITWIQKFDNAGQKPTKFSFKMTNSIDQPIKVTIPFDGVLENSFDNNIVVVDNAWRQNLTVTVKPVPPTQPTVYSSAAKSQVFSKTGCPAGTEGSKVTYSVPAAKYTSTISQADADSKAQNDINTNGQNYANTNGQCLQLYYSVEKTGNFYKNDCGFAGTVGPPVSYTKPAGSYTSTVSQQDADDKATTGFNIDGQAYANTNGTCGVQTRNVSVNVSNPSSKSYSFNISINGTFYNAGYTISSRSSQTFNVSMPTVSNATLVILFAGDVPVMVSSGVSGGIINQSQKTATFTGVNANTGTMSFEFR